MYFECTEDWSGRHHDDKWLLKDGHAWQRAFGEPLKEKYYRRASSAFFNVLIYMANEMKAKMAQFMHAHHVSNAAHSSIAIHMEMNTFYSHTRNLNTLWCTPRAPANIYERFNVDATPNWDRKFCTRLAYHGELFDWRKLQ